jgi:hypothetical protein
MAVHFARYTQDGRSGFAARLIDPWSQYMEEEVPHRVGALPESDSAQQEAWQ